MGKTRRIIPCDPKANFLSHERDIRKSVHRVLNSNSYILGREVSAFEDEFARYVGVRFGVGVASGTDALHLALRACGIGKGDEVVTVSHTAVATVSAIELCGATPVLADIDLNTYTIDPLGIKKAITKRTKAIIPVHLYGHPADMKSICNIARRHGLFVIEDCAQSSGAMYKNRKAGAWGDIAAFSFYPTKNLGGIGDGGMVLTDNHGLAKKVRLLRQYGWLKRYISVLPGLNSRLDELQAAILRVKLKYLDRENKKRQKIAKIYDKALSSTGLALPVTARNSTHVYHQYVVRAKKRDKLKKFLKKRGIDTLIHYPVPIHLQPAYGGRLKYVGSMSNTEKSAKEVLSLPIYPELSFRQAQHISDKILSWCNSR